MIPCQRHLFDVPEEIAYFDCAAFSPITKASRNAGTSGVGRKTQPWLLGNQEFSVEPDLARTIFSRLIHASPEDVALVPATSYGIATAAANLPVKPSQKIVLLVDQYPNNVLPWIEKRDNEGAELVFVKRASDDNFTDGIINAIDENTAIVALPHCFWTDGTVIDLTKVGKHCRKVNAALVVDATQSVGALPFDVNEIQPDFLVVSGYKWLLCPYTTSFLYVAPKRHDGVPIENAWSDHRQKDGGPDWRDGHMVYPEHWRHGASRFNMGEFANFITMPMAVAALKQLETWTIGEINISLQQITEKIIEGTKDLGLVAPASDRRAGHLTGLRLAKRSTANPLHFLQGALAEKKVFLSVRGDTIRIAPHLHISDNDIERLITGLSEIL